VSFLLCAGAAHVFSYSDVYSMWSEEQKLTASDGAAHERFGVGVSVYGDVIAVGAAAHGYSLTGGLYHGLDVFASKRHTIVDILYILYIIVMLLICLYLYDDIYRYIIYI
jgi:hypothetical protein